MHAISAFGRIALHAILAVALLLPLTAGAQSGTTATGTSNELNPAISLNSLFLAEKADEPSESDGFRAQEFELTVTSVVDSYFKAWASLAFEPSGSHGSHAHAEDDSLEEEEGGGVEIEEAYVTALGLPSGFGLKAGRFFVPLGRHNQLHTHQYPFIEAPGPVANVLGDHSVGDVGVLGSYLPELPWYVDLQAYVTTASAEAFEPESKRMAFGGRVESLFELSESATLEFGGSAFRGPGHEEEDLTFAGADVRLKWRDNRKTHGRAVNWVTEFLTRESDEPTTSGVYSTLQYRLSRQWWAGVLYGFTSLIHEGEDERLEEQEGRLQLAWVPGEFSAIRGEFGWLDPGEGDSGWTASLQLNFTIGAHPAHKY